MKLKLVTDFMDYYDHWFDRRDSDGQEFRRVTTEGPTRLQAFALLNKAGFATPPLIKLDKGIRKYVKHLDETMVVVYTKPKAHRGEGKLLLPFSSALGGYEGKWASLYVGNEIRKSFRFLYVGRHEFTIKYESDDLWRSNVGDVKVELVRHHKVKNRIGNLAKIDCPLFAIDGVNHIGQFMAFDFNIAPGMKGIGIEDILPAKDLVEELKFFIRRSEQS